MRKFNTCILIGMTSLFFSSCGHTSGSGDIISEKRNVGSFTGLNVAGGFVVEVRSGNSESITVEADDNLIDDIETEVQSGVLKIRCSKKNLRNTNFKVYITTALLNRITASAGADVMVKDVITADKFEAGASSGANIMATVRSPNVDVDASSSGDISISGHTKNLVAEASSGGDIDAFELQSETGKVSASSGSSAKVHASVSLTASASSGADIKYKGGASVTRSETSGGSIEKN